MSDSLALFVAGVLAGVGLTLAAFVTRDLVFLVRYHLKQRRERR